jgi:hypothetical protein
MRLHARTLFLVVLSAACTWAQCNSGSTGSDGALTYNTPGTYTFVPATSGQGNLDPSGDNIFNFTTVTIASGVTLVLTSENLRAKPVVWCASGAVNIAGTLNLSGANGANVNTANPWLTHLPAEPGPGGYSGGLGGVSFLGVNAAATGGFGPGAPGNIATEAYWGAGAAHASTGTYNDGFGNGGASGTTYGNDTLNPLARGSGGNGAPTTDTGGIGGGNGGAGGGAIRIVSSASITVSGSILARGGNGGAPDGNTPANRVQLTTGGSGSGGAIHLIAPTISGAGTLDVSGGTTVSGAGYTSGGGGVGWILLSANSNTFTGTELGFAFAGAFYIPTPILPGSVTITSINGVAAPANPVGDPTIPDVTIAAAGNVTVNIAASQVPIGTQVTLTLIPSVGAPVSTTCVGLAGTIAASVATCSITFPTGVSLTSATATW